MGSTNATDQQGMGSRESVSPSPSRSGERQSHLGLSESPAEIEIRSLPPTDRGKQAYLILAGCTLIQAPVWGYSFSFGVFQEYYITSPRSPFLSASSGTIATVGTTMNGLMYLLMPLTFTLLTRYPKLRPYCGPTGLCITQGVLCAIGSVLLFSPTTLYLDEWFITRKGMAYGTIWAGKSVGGVILPFAMSSLLSNFGRRDALQAWSAALVILTAPLLFFLKPRIPLSARTTRRPLSWKFLESSTFWMLEHGNVVQSLGYLLPTTYLASYAHSLGLPAITGAILLSMFSLASVPGALVLGFLNDRIYPTTTILISSLGSAFAVFLFWGLSVNISLLVAFVISYGFFAGGFGSTNSGVIHEFEGKDRNVDAGLVMGLLLGGRGVGFVVGGVASSALLNGAWSGEGTWGYDTEYGPVIVATGATALLGGWGWMWKMIRMAMA